MYKDLTGRKFGRWTIIERVGVNKFRQVLWKCSCLCGNTKEVPSNSLLTGKSKSCGCLQVEASRGKLRRGSRFGRLKVLSFDGVSKNRSLYRCRCDCGEEVVAQMHRLKQGTTTSCGCYRREIHTTHGMSQTPEYSRFCARLRRVRKIEAPGFHTLVDVLSLLEEQKGQCFYCSTDLQEYHVDHKIPLSRGGSDYKENLCLACPPCNLHKHNKTDKEYVELMSYKKN